MCPLLFGNKQAHTHVSIAGQHPPSTHPCLHCCLATTGHHHCLHCCSAITIHHPCLQYYFGTNRHGPATAGASRVVPPALGVVLSYGWVTATGGLVCQIKGGQPGPGEQQRHLAPSERLLHAQGWNESFGRLPPHFDLLTFPNSSLASYPLTIH